jgi:hypothetical protein
VRLCATQINEIPFDFFGDLCCVISVRWRIDRNGRRQATLGFLCGAIFCVVFSSTLAATVEWHMIGDPPSASVPPTNLVISPAAPVAGETISFVAPSDGKIYDNAQAAADICGNPLISVDPNNYMVTVTFTAAQDDPIPGPLLVSGVDGQFGPLLAGTWCFQVLSNSGALLFSSTFTVTGPPVPPSLGIALAGNQVVLIWPALATNYVLQTATDLSSGIWSSLTNGIAISGTNCVFTNATSSQAAYFRLQEQ